MTKKNQETKSRYTEDWLPIDKIANGIIYLNEKDLIGKKIVTGVRIEPKNIFISDQQTQNNTIYALRNFYNSLDYEYWLICCDRPVDINLYKSELEIMYNKDTDQSTRKLIIEDIRKCEAFIGPRYNAVDTEFFILFKEYEKDLQKAQKKVHNMISGLANAGLNSRQITDEDIRVLLDSFFNDSKKVEFGTVMTDV